MNQCYRIFHQSDSNVLGLAYIQMNISLPKSNRQQKEMMVILYHRIALLNKSVVVSALCALCSAIPSKRKHKYKYKHSGLHCIVHKVLS